MTTFTVLKSDVLSALSKLTGIVESKTSVPILSNIAVNATSAGLTLNASDMEINATVNCPAVVDEVGDFTIPARQFYDICKKASEDNITVTHNVDKATVKSGRSKFTLGTFPVEDFPSFQVHTGNDGFKIDSGFLLKLLDNVVNSMSDQESQYYLRGVFIHEVDGNLKAVATNGHTLSQSLGDSVGVFPPVIIPRKTVGVLQKLLHDWEGDVVVLSVDNKIQFTIGNMVLISKVIDGTFPDYARILPKQYEGKFSFDTDAAIKAVDRVCSVEDKVSNTVKFTVTNGTLTLERVGQDENGVDQIDADYAGDDFVFHLKSDYVSQALAKIRTGKTVVQFNNPETALLFTPENDDTASWLIMPNRGRG